MKHRRMRKTGVYNLDPCPETITTNSDPSLLLPPSCPLHPRTDSFRVHHPPPSLFTDASLSCPAAADVQMVICSEAGIIIMPVQKGQVTFSRALIICHFA